MIDSIVTVKKDISACNADIFKFILLCQLYIYCRISSNKRFLSGTAVERTLRCKMCFHAV